MRPRAATADFAPACGKREFVDCAVRDKLVGRRQGRGRRRAAEIGRRRHQGNGRNSKRTSIDIGISLQRAGAPNIGTAAAPRNQPLLPALP